MTMNRQGGRAEIPEISFPRITFMATDPIVPRSDNEPLSWVLGSQHPFLPSATVVAMYDGPESVDIYSTIGQEDKQGIRDRVPLKYVRFIREMMPLDVFAVELAHAELDEGDDDDEEPEAASQPVAQA